MREYLKSVYRTVAIICPPFAIFIDFMTNILCGYRLYAKVKRSHGTDCYIFATTMRGTGDYYLCGLILRELTGNFVFLCGGKNEKRVSELFPLLRGHIVCVKYRLVIPSDRFTAFYGDKLNIKWLHQSSNTFAVCCKRTGSLALCGYKGVNMLDWYKAN
ncbi:MAG: hypothetical protein LBS62_05325 [Clostridiales bacterium]|jgi:hypothetical protein|nr:hypothetical protein [Clostridiales bacterium]